MRLKPQKICAKAGCTTKTKDRYCKTHKKQKWAEHDKTRPSSTQRGYDHAWTKFRKSYLERNPLCLFCKESGLLVTATEVDHIKPLADNPHLKYSNENLRPLCKKCHSTRTWHEQSIGANNAKKKADEKVYQVFEDGNALGLSDREMKKIFKNERISISNNVIKGFMNPYKVSSQQKDKMRRNDTYDRFPKEEIRNLYRSYKGTPLTDDPIPTPIKRTAPINSPAPSGNFFDQFDNVSAPAAPSWVSQGDWLSHASGRLQGQ